MIRPWPTIIIALLLLLPSPLILFAILLAGDSCCGENTSGAMASVTFTFVITIFMIACCFHSLFKLIRPSPSGDDAVMRSSLLSTVPSALLYGGFLLFLTAQWIF